MGRLPRAVADAWLCYMIAAIVAWSSLLRAVFPLRCYIPAQGVITQQGVRALARLLWA